MKRALIFFIFMPVLAIAAESGNWEKVIIIPRQEAAKDSSLVSFLDSLDRAIDERDSLFVYDHLHPDVSSTYGDSSTVGSFKRYWTPYDQYSRFWKELKEKLEQGGKLSRLKDGNLWYTAPYIVHVKDDPCLPGWDDDLSRMYYKEVGKLLADTAVVYVGNDSGSFKDREAPFKDGTYFIIKLVDGRQGYLECRYIKGAAIGTRFSAVNYDGKWMIKYFIGGF